MHSSAYETQEELPSSHNNIQQHYPAQTGRIQHGLVPVRHSCYSVKLSIKSKISSKAQITITRQSLDLQTLVFAL